MGFLDYAKKLLARVRGEGAAAAPTLLSRPPNLPGNRHVIEKLEFALGAVTTIDIEIDPQGLVVGAAAALKVPAHVGRADRKDMQDFTNRFLRAHVAKQMNRLTLWGPELACELVDVAAKLRSGRDNTRFVGIGASPSYVLYGLDRLSRDAPADVAYVPFSGRYYERTDSFNSRALTFEPAFPLYFRAMEKNRNAYRTFLAKQGLTPSVCVKKFNRTGRVTALIDNIQTGASFASFLSFMHQWARQTGVDTQSFKKAFKCIALSEGELPQEINIPGAGFSMPLETIQISEPLGEVLSGRAAFETDRFIPPYSPLQWAQPPQEVLSANGRLVEQIKQLIDSEVERRLGPRRDLSAKPAGPAPASRAPGRT